MHGRPMVVPSFTLAQDQGGKSDDLDMKVSAQKSWGVFASSIVVSERAVKATRWANEAQMLFAAIYHFVDGRYRAFSTQDWESIKLQSGAKVGKDTVLKLAKSLRDEEIDPDSNPLYWPLRQFVLSNRMLVLCNFDRVRAVHVVKFQEAPGGEALVVRANMEKVGGNAWGVLNAVVLSGKAAETLEIYDAAASESVGELCPVANLTS